MAPSPRSGPPHEDQVPNRVVPDLRLVGSPEDIAQAYLEDSWYIGVTRPNRCGMSSFDAPEQSVEPGELVRGSTD